MAKTALEAAFRILEQAGEPLDARTLTGRILEAKLWTTAAQFPHQSVHAYIAVDIKKRGVASRFQRSARGRFALRQWGLPEFVGTSKAGVADEVLLEPETRSRMSFVDAAELILDQYGDGKPLHHREMVRRAIEMGLVVSGGLTPEATLRSAVIREIARDEERGEIPRFVYQKGLIGLTADTRKDTPLLDQIRKHNEAVKDQVHGFLQNLAPSEFEELVGRLLVAIGFEDVEVTTRSGDGGIDVRGTLVVGTVIRTRMAVQVKRWKNNVQTPTVQQVRGSLGTHEQGLIISTGDFSAGARDEAQRVNAVPVALMNGSQLVDLLVEHQLMTRRREQFIHEFVDPSSRED